MTLVTPKRAVGLGLLALLSAGLIAVLFWPKPHRGAILAEGLWTDYRARFLATDGRIIDRGVDGVEITHTEGQGYGMLLAEAAGDRKNFALIWDWTRQHLARPDGLYSWRWQNGEVADRNNASDGDILIAWALLRAARDWNDRSYRQEAERLAKIVGQTQILEKNGMTLLLPGIEGFVKGERVTVNLSYWVFPALRDFAAAFGGPWSKLQKTGMALAADARFGTWRLPPDWLDIEGSALQPAADFPPQFGFNAVRVPLYLIWSGPEEEDGLLAPYRHFWTVLAKGPPPAWIDLSSGASANYAWQGGMAAIGALTLDRQDKLPLPRSDEGYYSWSLALLCAVAQKERGP